MAFEGPKPNNEGNNHEEKLAQDLRKEGLDVEDVEREEKDPALFEEQAEIIRSSDSIEGLVKKLLAFKSKIVDEDVKEMLDNQASNLKNLEGLLKEDPSGSKKSVELFKDRFTAHFPKQGNVRGEIVSFLDGLVTEGESKEESHDGEGGISPEETEDSVREKQEPESSEEAPTQIKEELESGVKEVNSLSGLTNVLTDNIQSLESGSELKEKLKDSREHLRTINRTIGGTKAGSDKRVQTIEDFLGAGFMSNFTKKGGVRSKVKEILEKKLNEEKGKDDTDKEPEEPKGEKEEVEGETLLSGRREKENAIKRYIKEEFGDISLPPEVNDELIRVGVEAIESGKSVEEAEHLVEEKAIQVSEVEDSGEKEERGPISDTDEGGEKSSYEVKKQLFITEKMKSKLGTLGYSDEDIRAMKPEEAREIIDKFKDRGFEEKKDKTEEKGEADTDKELEEKESIFKRSKENLKERVANVSTFLSGIKEKWSEWRGDEKKTPREVWKEMSEEERREKYGDTYEMREKYFAFEDARANYVALERKYRRSFLGKFRPGTQKEYSEAKREYEEKRAEYIGEKAVRLQAEKALLAQEKAKQHQEGLFENVRQAWRMTGDVGLMGLTEGTRFEAKGRLNKFVQRNLSVRGAIKAGFLVGAYAGGVAAAPLAVSSIAFLAARSAFTGVNIGMAKYTDALDIFEKESNLPEEELSKEAIKKMEYGEIEEMLATYESRALYLGKRVIKDKNYKNLGIELKRRFEEESPEDREIKDLISDADDFLVTKSTEAEKEEKKRKRKAVTWGVTAAAATPVLGWIFGLDEEAGEASKEVKETVQEMAQERGLSVSEYSEKVRNFINEGGLFRGENMSQEFTGLHIGDYGPEATQAAEEGAYLPTDEEGLFAFPRESMAEALEPLSEPDLEFSITDPTDIPYYETVQKGEGLWHAAERLVENGELTQEQFSEAWSSPASVVELPSGEVAHISEVGLVHEGDQLIYVPETGDAPAHFRVVDYAEDVFKMGSNEDLAQVYNDLGKELPEWLQEAVGVEEVYEGATESADAGFQSFDLSQELPEGIGEDEFLDFLDSQDEELIQEAASGSLESTGEVIGDLPWGEAQFVTDKSGAIVDVNFAETFDRAARSQFVREASESILEPSYEAIINSDLPRYVQESPSLHAEVLPRKIAETREAAWKVFQMQELMSHFEENSPQWIFLRDRIKKIVSPVSLFSDNQTTIFEGHILSTRVFKDFLKK